MSTPFIYPVEYNTYGLGSTINMSYTTNNKNEWRQDFKIYDHLGSLRAVLRKKTQQEFLNDPTFPPTYYPMGSYDYEAFGKKITISDNSKDKRGFIGKEEDKESALGDFGVRKYDDGIGRFTSIDQLWEKYPGWTPYQYSMNNPVNMSDDNGKLVKDSQGAPVFVPVGNTVTVNHPSGSSVLMQPGVVITNNGSTVMAFKNLSDDKGFDSDCHGATFADSKLWINNEQVNDILNGDNFKEVSNPKKGDKVIYYDETGSTVHSMTVSKVAKDGSVTVKGEGGLEVGSKVQSLDGSWPGQATFKFYRKKGKDVKVNNFQKNSIINLIKNQLEQGPE